MMKEIINFLETYGMVIIVFLIGFGITSSQSTHMSSLIE